MSVAGGLPRAVERAQVHRCDALQIFTSRWRGRPLSIDEVRAFRRLVNDPRFAGLPVLLETSKANGGNPTGVIHPGPLDAANLALLRGL